jgi:hypothetical protein
MDVISDLLSAPVLSVRQPWASYLVSGLKTVELRSWSTRHRGWIWIHAGKKLDLDAVKLLQLRGDDFSRGGLVGLAKLEDCVLFESEEEWLRLRDEHLSPGFYPGTCFGWRFSDSFVIDRIIECPGELGLFHISQSIIGSVAQAATSAATHS